MFNPFTLFNKRKRWDFPRGIHPPEMKTLSNSAPLRHLPLARRFIIPLIQHTGYEGEICVRPGESVLRGQPLTSGCGHLLPVHSPTSGIIESVGHHMTPHPSGLSELCIFLAADGEDRWTERQPLLNYQCHRRGDLISRIHQAGIAGLGGAGFPTGVKLELGQHNIDTLIINAAECEPYITADDRLMQEHAEEVAEGCRILAWILQPVRTVIAVEDNKPHAIHALEKALAGSCELQLQIIPTRYPSGGAKQLAKIITNREVPHRGHSSDIGVLTQNVATAFAVKRAIIDGEPLTERVVTLTGGAIAQPGNVWGRLGTPVSHLLYHAGLRPQSEPKVVMGGPLMGFTLPSLDVPVIKITNCLLAPTEAEIGKPAVEQSCIRCGLCAEVCPVKLLPQQLYWYSRGNDHQKARTHHISDCIECGACAWVCPSNIPLVHYFRQEKAEIRAIDQETLHAAQAKARFEAREDRLKKEKLAREKRHQQAKLAVTASDRDTVNAALARVKTRNSQAAGEIQPDDIAADRTVNARTGAQKVSVPVIIPQSDNPATAELSVPPVTKPHSIAAETATTSVRAEQTINTLSLHNPPDSTRKAAVEAALARVKARRMNAPLLQRHEE